MLKIKDGYILRKVAGENMVVPFGSDLDLNQMITLNDTGAFLWAKLEDGAEEEDLVEALLAEYEVTEERACAAVAAFIVKLKENDFLA